MGRHCNVRRPFMVGLLGVGVRDWGVGRGSGGTRLPRADVAIGLAVC